MTAVDSHRSDLHAVQQQAHQLADRIAGATGDAAALGFVEQFEALRSRLFSQRSWAWLAHQRNLTDSAAQAERDFWNSAEGTLQQLETLFFQALLGRETVLLPHLGPQIFKIARSAALPHSLEAEDLSQNAAKAHSDLSTLLSRPHIEMAGDTFSAAGLRKLFTHPSRDIRRAAWEARDAFCAAHADELNASITRLNALRHRRARALGFTDYAELAYREQRRVDHTPDDVARFRSAVLTHVVPLCAEVIDHHASRLRIDSMMVYDEELVAPTGAPKPHGDLAWFLDTATAVCREVHPRLGECMTTIVREGLFDLEARPTKVQTGACMFLADRRLPFILATYSGYPRDVGTIIHELGHAFQQYAARQQPLLDYVVAGAELGEFYAMGMTVVTIPWLSRFFPSTERTLTRTTIWNLIRSIPFIALIDHFEHELFTQPARSVREYDLRWRELEKLYMPWRTYGPSMPNLSAGATWMLFSNTYPAYSIGYALAAASALQLFPLALADQRSTVDAYAQMCTAGASVGFEDASSIGGLSSPFQPETLQALVSELRSVLL